MRTAMLRGVALLWLGAAAAAAEANVTATNTTVVEGGCSTSKFLDTMCFDQLDGGAGGIALEVFLFFFCFLGLAIVCDEYLVMSLETLCLRWGIREDVAGCTFMAFGSAAPEIIVNAVATLKASESSTQLGISAILGSGMIAFMAIPAFCGIFGAVDGPLHLKRRPLVRDTVAYIVGLTELCYFLQNDSKVDTLEGVVMVTTYALYIVVVVVSPKIRKAFCMGDAGKKGGEAAHLLGDDAEGGGFLSCEKGVAYDKESIDDGAATEYRTVAGTPGDLTDGDSRRGGTPSPEPQDRDFIPEIVVDGVHESPGAGRSPRVLSEAGSDDETLQFWTREGAILAFPTDGPVATIDGVPVGDETHGVTIEIGRRYVVRFDTATDLDSSLIRYGESSEVVLPMKGCERAASHIGKRLKARGIPCQRTVAVGTDVHALHEGEYEHGWVVERDPVADTYTIEFHAVGQSPATSPRSGPMLSPSRGMGSPRPGERVPGIAMDDIRPFIFRRKQIFQAPPTQACEGGVGGTISPRGNGSEWGGESLYSTYTAMSLWRRHWWHTSHAETVISSVAAERLCAHWYSPLLVFVYFWQVVFKYTIPYHEIEPETVENEAQLEQSVMKSGWRQRLYPVTFVISFIWVAVFSFIISTVAARWADISGLGGGCIGLVLISLGAEIPDCIQSVTVAKRGYGSMAVSNACGSQITNVFLGLGLPWLIYNLVHSKPVIISDPDILTYFMALDVTGVLAMFLCLVGVALCSKMNKALLTRQKAYFLLMLYVLVIGGVFAVDKLAK